MDEPTPYPDVNAVLHELLDGVREVLGEEFVGLYLYGSLASGEFDPESSDIDFLVVTEGVLPAETLAELAAMHARIAAGPSRWARELEGSYIPRDAIRRYDPANAAHPTIGIDWPFGVSHHESDWVIQRHIIREQGVALAGPPPRTLIDPVPPEALRRGVLGILRTWWSLQLTDPSLLRTRDYQAFAILTMCRALYTLEHGTIVSKPAAARWAQATLPEPWPALVEQALAWRHDRAPGDVSESLDFIRYTIDRAVRSEIAAADQC